MSRSPSGSSLTISAFSRRPSFGALQVAVASRGRMPPVRTVTCGGVSTRPSGRARAAPQL
eukprot:8888552-Pyramimonas_sp.AAC.1